MATLTEHLCLFDKDLDVPFIKRNKGLSIRYIHILMFTFFLLLWCKRKLFT